MHSAKQLGCLGNNRAAFALVCGCALERGAKSADIASRQQIPEAYLKQLLITLRKAGLVRSVRGPKGGHELAYPPDRITLADAVIVLEGGYQPVENLDVPLPLEAPPEADLLRGVWRQIDAVTGQVLESTTLGDLCRRKLAQQRQIMYYI